MPLEEPRGELPEDRLLPPEDRVALGRGELLGALNELFDPLDPLERLLEFQLELLRLESVPREGSACIHRLRRLFRSGVTTVG